MLDDETLSISEASDDEVTVHFAYSASEVHLVDDQGLSRCGKMGCDSSGSTIRELRIVNLPLCEDCEMMATEAELASLSVAYV